MTLLFFNLLFILFPLLFFNCQNGHVNQIDKPFFVIYVSYFMLIKGTLQVDVKKYIKGHSKHLFEYHRTMIIDNIIIHLVSQKYSSEYVHASIKCYTTNSNYLPWNLTSSIFASRHSFEYKFFWMKIYQRIRHVKTRIDVTFHIKEN